MDVEGLEFRLLDVLEAHGQHRLIDELFVEVHYDREGWRQQARRSYGPRRPVGREEAERYVRRWRELVPAFHLWG